MIDFSPFFATMEKRHKSGYNLLKDKVIGGGTLQRIKSGQSVSTDTINDLCNYLRCKPMDIIRYTPDKSDGEQLQALGFVRGLCFGLVRFRPVPSGYSTRARVRVCAYILLYIIYYIDYAIELQDYNIYVCGQEIEKQNRGLRGKGRGKEPVIFGRPRPLYLSPSVRPCVPCVGRPAIRLSICPGARRSWACCPPAALLLFIAYYLQAFRGCNPLSPLWPISYSPIAIQAILAPKSLILSHSPVQSHWIQSDMIQSGIVQLEILQAYSPISYSLIQSYSLQSLYPLQYYILYIFIYALYSLIVLLYRSDLQSIHRIQALYICIDTCVRLQVT